MAFTNYLCSDGDSGCYNGFTTGYFTLLVSSATGHMKSMHTRQDTQHFSELNTRFLKVQLIGTRLLNSKEWDMVLGHLNGLERCSW